MAHSVAEPASLVAAVRRHRRAPGARAWPTLVVAFFAGCAPALSTFQTARVAPKGHVTVAAGLEGSIPVGSLTDAIDTGKALADKVDRGESLSSEDEWRVLDAGMQLVLSPPSVGAHLMVAYVPADRLELSLRYAGSALRFGGRYQVSSRDDGRPLDLTLGIGISRFTYKFPVADIIPILAIDDFTRWQIDLPILAGVQNRWFRTWFGPRFVATFFDTAMRLELQAQDPVLASLSGNAYYVGGQAGVGFGYRWVFFAFELTIVEMIGSAQVDAPAIAASPSRTVTLSGPVVYPSFGLMGEF